jgi:phage baseplate assembly protein gpV
MDGEWFGVLRGDVEINGSLTVDDDIATGSLDSVNGHVHGGVKSGNSTTSGPQ